MSDEYNPHGEKPGTDAMCPVTALFGIGDIAEREPVEASLVGSRIDGVNGKKDKPGNDPDRGEDDDHHAEEADEHVCVNAVETLDLTYARA